MAGKATASKSDDTVTNIEDVEAALEELDLEDETFEAASDEVIEELELSDDDVSDDDLRDLDIQMTREEAYSEQTSETDADAGAAKEARADKTKRAAGKKRATGKSASKTSTPRTPRDINAVPAEFFVLKGDPAKMDQAALDKAKADTMALMPAQKKIAEKFENIFSALAAGKQPSVYVVKAFKLLESKGTVSSADIVADFTGSGYSQGTSMSQCGQIMNLFATIGVAERSKNVLTASKDSLVAERLRKVIA